MQVASVNVSKWNTSSYGYQHLNSYGEYYPIEDEDFQLADSFAECAINNDISNNFNTNALGLMEGENHVIFCFVLLFSCLIFFLIRHPNMIAQIL